MQLNVNKAVLFCKSLLTKKVKLPLVDKEMHDEIVADIKTEKDKLKAEYDKCSAENDLYLKKLVNSFFKDSGGKSQQDMKIIYDVYNKKWIKFSKNFNHTHKNIQLRGDTFQQNVTRILMEHQKAMKAKENPSTQLKPV